MTRRLLFAAFIVVIAVGAFAQRPSTAAPLPLDPLTPAEQAAAERIALQDQRVHAMTGEGARPVVTLFIAPKRGDQTEPSGRFAEVIIHNEVEGGGARVLVSITGAAVVDVERLTERNVPIGQSDIDRASALALESASVQRLLGGPEAARTFHVAHGPASREAINENRVEGVSDRGIDPDDPCTTHRCVALFFRSHNRYIAMNQVSVDLTAKRVYVREGGKP